MQKFPIAQLNKLQKLAIICASLVLIDLLLGFIVTTSYLPTFESTFSFLFKQSPTDMEMLKTFNNSHLSGKDLIKLRGKVLRQAKTTNYVEISGCIFYPTITKVVIDTAITFSNSDSRPHTLTFPAKKFFVIPAHSSMTVPMDFIQRAPTVVGIGCDHNQQVSGIFYIALPKKTS